MSNKEIAKKEIENLVKKYELLLKEGRITEYNESNTRKDFILPLFSALGWEITNINEVQEETRVSRDRVDYSFNLAGISKFYLEAKALKSDLDKQEYAEQAIDYAYNKGVPWAVLTDFEKIKVFNAEWKAKTLRDSQFLEIAYNEYLNRFDELWLLSKESLTQGFLDKEAERRLKKDKKQPISKQILSDLLKAREKLTRNILEHPRLNKVSEEELDESVQRILDRLIFIRTAEDRIIEQNHLLSAVRLWRESRRDLSPALQKIFRDFDNGYNSKLFEKHLSEDLVIDDEILAEIIDSLYQTPDGSRYDFSAISADVLGSIYEQYLGHILKKTPKSTHLKETHQHRKEMGIYYTPTYIVDYIVKNTLGEILKKTKPKDVNKIKVLDPACGSGSFLIRAFNEFVNYWQKHSPGEFGYFRKIEILKNNLYGVDLDKQAVEIAQMNLLLKTLYHRERLPMLEHIKQGNSLISGTEEELKKYFADNWQSKHPFNWNDEFKEIMSAGGFDVVIGNPPYVRPEKVAKSDRFYYLNSGHFEKTFGRFDLYILFIEKALNLLKQGGYFSFIIPTSFFNQNYSKNLRKWILENFTIKSVFDLSDIKVFESATVQSSIIVIRKKYPSKNHKIIMEKPKMLSEIGKAKSCIFQQIFNEIPQNMIRTDINDTSLLLIEKTKLKSIKLEDICYVVIGAVPHDSRTGASKDRLISFSKTQNSHKKYLEGKDIGRYSINWRGFYINYLPAEMHRPKFPELFENNKLIVRNISTQKGLLAIIDEEKYYTNDTVSLCLPWYLLKSVKERGTQGTEEQIRNSEQYNLRHLLSLINSKLLNFYFKKVLSSILHVYPEAIRNLPIYKIDFSNPKEKKMHDDLVKLVDRILELNKQLQQFGDKLTDERRKIESEIQKTDQEIDEMVYQLYGLTEEEIKIIEGS